MCAVPFVIVVDSRSPLRGVWVNRALLLTLEQQRLWFGESSAGLFAWLELRSGFGVGLLRVVARTLFGKPVWRNGDLVKSLLPHGRRQSVW